MIEAKLVLVALRHAHAVNGRPGQPDYDRPLDAKGQKQSATAGRALLDLGARPDRIVCSGSVRTRQTLAHLGTDFEGVNAIFDDSLYSGGAEDYLAAIRSSGDIGCVMVVGHNPSIAEFIARLVGNGEAKALRQLAEGVRKGAFARVEFGKPWSAVTKGDGFLSHFVAPAR